MRYFSSFLTTYASTRQASKIATMITTNTTIVNGSDKSLKKGAETPCLVTVVGGAEVGGCKTKMRPVICEWFTQR